MTGISGTYSSPWVYQVAARTEPQLLCNSHVRGDRQTDISTRELKSKVAHATATKNEKEGRDADLWEDEEMENPYRGLQEHRVHMRSQTKEGECASRRNGRDYVPRRVKAGGTGVCLSF